MTEGFLGPGSAPPLLAFTGLNQSKPVTQNKSASNNYTIFGIDTVASTLYAIDTSGGVLRISADSGATWSNSKGLPTGVSWFNVSKIIRFGDYIYALCKVDATSVISIFRATPTTGNTALTWSSALMSEVTGSNGFPTDLNADDSYMYVGEYGDPTGGPSLYRISLADANGAGTNWVTMLTATGYRHIHGVFPDPYNPGHVWLALGDGVALPLRRSTDYGATFTAVSQAGGVMPQVVQVSFSPTKAYCTSDSNYSTLIVVDKTTLVWTTASLGYTANMPVPSRSANKTWDPASVADGAMTSTTVTFTGVVTGIPVRAAFTTAVPAGCVLGAEVTAADTVTVTLINHSGGAVDLASGTLYVHTVGGYFDGSPFYGRVDPATGVFYCVTQSATGTTKWSGLFCILYAGGPLVLLDWGTTGYSGEMFIFGSNLWFGGFHRPLLAVDTAVSLTAP